MSSLPPTYRKLVSTAVSSDFRNITKVVTVPLPTPNHDQILVKNIFAGINASDINYTAGKYVPGIRPPFDTGFEAIGEIVAIGENVKNFRVGEAVIVSSYGAFSEYQLLKPKQLLKCPTVSPNMLPLLVSGLTASIALKEVGEMKSGETVLVTAGAGATGLFAVQLAKLAGNHVIATCSDNSKIPILKKLGCSRVINYKEESLDHVLKKEYPKGVNLVYESVGGEFFDICVRHLAVKGRLIVIGFISGYKDQSGWKKKAADEREKSGKVLPLPVELLRKSASVRGFFLNDYTDKWGSYLSELSKLVQRGDLQSVVDDKKFIGLEQVADAVDYLYSGKNIGKVVVQLDPNYKNTNTNKDIKHRL